MPSRATIDEFLGCQRLALVGASRDEKAFSSVVRRELIDRGYEVFPVNPRAADCDGFDGWFATVADLPEVDGAIIMVPAPEAAGAVTACADRGITRVWLHRGAGAGSVTPEAVAAAHERGLSVVDGACPLMFLDETGWIHRLHRFMAGRRITAA